MLFSYKEMIFKIFFQYYENQKLFFSNDYLGSTPRPIPSQIFISLALLRSVKQWGQGLYYNIILKRPKNKKLELLAN